MTRGCIHPSVLVVGGRALAALSLVMLSAACDFPSGQRPEGVRFVTGALVPPDEDLAGRQNTGLQMAAVAIGTAEDVNDVDIATSEVFDSSRLESARFSLSVNDDSSFVLVLQVPGAARGGFGALLGQLRFDDGRGGASTLLPPGGDDVELGSLRVLEPAAGSVRRMEAGEASNPLGQVDTDEDGLTDLSDDDDDGDGTLDTADDDVGGDGVPDALQLIEALPDGNRDGVPDVFGG